MSCCAQTKLKSIFKTRECWCFYVSDDDGCGGGGGGDGGGGGGGGDDDIAL